MNMWSIRGPHLRGPFFLWVRAVVDTTPSKS